MSPVRFSGLHLLALVVLIGFPSAAAVLISPALPALSQYFGVLGRTTQQLMIFYVGGYALSQLIYAPLANHFGRKPAIYTGLFFYFLGCLLCVASVRFHHFGCFVWGRLVMALGAGVGMVMTFTMINDVYLPAQARAMTGYVTLSYALMPALAVALGGVLTTYWGWTSCLMAYLIYGGIVCLAVRTLPETRQPDGIVYRGVAQIAQGYGQAVANGRVVWFALIYGLIGVYIYTIASVGPFIGINRIGLSASSYGLLMLLPYLGQALGAFGAGRLGHRLPVYTFLGLAYWGVGLGTALMAVCFALHWVNAWALFLPVFLIMLVAPAVYSTVTVMALSGHADKANGSAVMSFITMSTVFVAMFGLTVWPVSQPVVLPLVLSGVFLLALGVLQVVKHRYAAEG